MDEFDIGQNKVSQSAQRIIDRAVEEFHRRRHALLTNEHIFFAFAQLESASFSDAMHGCAVNPREVLQALHEELQMLPTLSEHKLRVAPATKAVFKLAFQLANRAGRETMEASDLVLGNPGGEQWRCRLDHQALRRRADASRATNHRTHSGRRTARGGTAEAVRVAAAPQATRDQSESARAARQGSAGLWPRQGDSADARDPLSPRTVELRHADR